MSDHFALPQGTTLAVLPPSHVRSNERAAAGVDHATCETAAESERSCAGRRECALREEMTYR